MSEPRIVIVGFPSAQILDITGPLEVFSTASRFLTIPRYATRLVSADGGPVVSTSGLEFPLHDETLRPGTTRGVSNVFAAAEARITVGDGCLVAVQPRPEREESL